MDGLTLPPEITGLLHQFSAFEGKNGIDRQFQGRNVQVILPEGSAAMKRNHRTLLLWQIALGKSRIPLFTGFQIIGDNPSFFTKAAAVRLSYIPVNMRCP